MFVNLKHRMAIERSLSRELIAQIDALPEESKAAANLRSFWDLALGCGMMAKIDPADYWERLERERLARA